jgi:hypothetical protein
VGSDEFGELTPLFRRPDADHGGCYTRIIRSLKPVSKQCYPFLERSGTE